MPSWRSGKTHGFCVTGGHPPILLRSQPRRIGFGQPARRDPGELCEHTMGVTDGPPKPELSTWLETGTFYLAPTQQTNTANQHSKPTQQTNTANQHSKLTQRASNRQRIVRFDTHSQVRRGLRREGRNEYSECNACRRERQPAAQHQSHDVPWLLRRAPGECRTHVGTGSRKTPAEEADPGLPVQLGKILEETSAGDPMSELRWNE
jgi:hypothetical protein